MNNRHIRRIYTRREFLYLSDPLGHSYSLEKRVTTVIRVFVVYTYKVKGGVLLPNNKMETNKVKLI